MYQPTHFREDDLATQHALIRAHPLGLLITAGASGLMANAVPFLLDGCLSDKGTLQVHVAKANPQWRTLAAGAEPLIVFQGADSYITPSWYATKQETGKVVPTWNYAIVQVRGRARIIDNPAWLRVQVERLTGVHEKPRDAQWAVSDAPENFIAAQLKGIIGIEIEITAIEGKWKVSQNRPASDIAKVTAGLEDGADAHANAAMADLVREYGSAR
jgi:transcriptional regulator